MAGVTLGYPYWLSTKLALRMGTAALADERGHAVTVNAVTCVDTPFSPLTGNVKCARLQGNSYISIADAADLELGSGNFYMRGWVRLTGYSPSYTGAYAAMLVGKDSPSGRAFNFRIVGTASAFSSLSFSTAGADISVNRSFSLNQWYFLEVSKVDEVLRFFVNGQQVGVSAAHALGIPNVSTPITVGGISYTGYQYYLNGYMLEWVIGTDGGNVADYTPPSTPFIAAPHLISGDSAKTVSGNPVDRVAVFPWPDGVKRRVAIPGANGSWSCPVDVVGRYGITYMANGYQPITHGPYNVGL